MAERVVDPYDLDWSLFTDGPGGKRIKEEEVIFVGGFVFDNCQRGIYLASIRNDLRATRPLLLPRGFSPENVPNNMRDFSHFSDLEVRCSSPQCLEIDEQNPLGSDPWLRIRITGRDAETDVISTKPFSEKEVLQVFTGENGGLVFFQDDELVQQVGLVLPRTVNKASTGFVYMFDPKGPRWNSTDGLGSFLKELDTELDEVRGHVNLEINVLEALALNKQIGRLVLPFLDENRYTETCLAFARMAEISEPPQAETYLDFLRRNVPGFHEDKVRMPLRRGPLPDPNLTQRVKAKLASQEYKEPPMTAEEKENWFVNSLKTEELRQFRLNMQPHLNSKNDIPWSGFIYQLERMIPTAKSADAFEDIERVLESMLGLPFIKQNLGFFMADYDEEEPIGTRINYETTGFSFKGKVDLLNQLRADNRAMRLSKLGF